MNKLLGLVCILGFASCTFDVMLIAQKSRLMAELGWGIPSPFTYSLLAGAFVMTSAFAVKR